MTPEATASPTVAPTATPAPEPTATPEPSPTPEPTATSEPTAPCPERGDDTWLYVTNYRPARVFIFTPDGEQVCAWGTEGSGIGQLWEPHGVVLDQHGNVYVADSRNKRIQRFTARGEVIDAWTTELGEGSDRGYPTALAFSADYQTLYVIDRYIGALKLFTPDGELISVLESTLGMVSVHARPHGEIRIGDSTNYIWGFGPEGAADSAQRIIQGPSWNIAWSMATSPDGRFIVSWEHGDEKTWYLATYNADNSFNSVLVSNEVEELTFAFESMLAITTDSDGLLYVASAPIKYSGSEPRGAIQVFDLASWPIVELVYEWSESHTFTPAGIAVAE